MPRKTIVTKDGSTTLLNMELNEHYHSINGAYQESMHVFIEAGLNFIKKESISIFEMGFGTGLNCLLTCMNAFNRKINYVAIEKYPLVKAEYEKLNYCDLINNSECKSIIKKIQEAKWNIPFIINYDFTLTKFETDLIEFDSNQLFDLIYFDAFSPESQPELWTLAIFEKLYLILNPGGVLVTYCAKGYVRRNMQQCGFIVERLPGSPGKREMLRAIKI